MIGTGIRIARLFGVEVRIDVSWIFIALLVAWSFYVRFDLLIPGLDNGQLIALAVGSVIVFFGSVVIHELSHSLVARRLGVPVEGITLFLFGGVTQTRMEARQPRHEFLIAVVGPLTSFVLAGLLWALVNFTGDVFPGPVRFALGYLGWLNLFLGAFNLLPGFPLDGGRVLRSILWRITGSITKATRGAARGGQVIAAIMIGFGLLAVFSGDLTGLWLAAIGWFLMQAASGADQEAQLRRLLRDVKAKDLMSPELVTIPSDATIAQAVDDYFLRYDHSAFPVVDGEASGLITLRTVRQIPRDQWEVRQVWSASTGLDQTCTVGPNTPMDQVIDRLRQQQQDRVLVMEDKQVVGIITPRDVGRWVRRSEELGLNLPSK